MARHVLVYQHNSDFSNDTDIEFPANEDALHKRARELLVESQGKIEILVAGWLQCEYSYKPLQYATAYEVEQK